MSAHGFKSLFMAASVAGAALGCYLVSLNVASERAKLEMVEGKIVNTQHDIRLLQTEIGTRGRLAQLERWNVGFIRLSAPTADQFLEGGFQLATMIKPAPKAVIGAPVVLASAPIEQGVTRPAGTSDSDDAVPQTARAAVATPNPAPSAEDMMYVASYQRPATAVRPAASASVKPNAPKTAATKSVKVAAVDALAPLPKPKSTAKATPPAAASASGSAPRKSKESGTPQ
ncbi:hypothetical protein [Sphingomonas sp.]|uniref:hypothetical protein n=1 Tax=Sphingomonas sp. TaxID=28214 RepID=UPI00286C9478|nr:hypothetical protein [Sphingomonas sp.]